MTPKSPPEIPLTPFFIERTQSCTTNLRIWYLFGQETYIHSVAQETMIMDHNKKFRYWIKLIYF